jgi:hypothetical protein
MNRKTSPAKMTSNAAQEEREGFLRTYQERVLKMLAEANDLPNVTMWVRVASLTSAADIELVQEVVHEDFKEQETVPIMPAPAPNEEYKLDIMQDNLNEALTEQMKRHEAADLRKQQKQLMEQHFTKEQLELMAKY